MADPGDHRGAAGGGLKLNPGEETMPVSQAAAIIGVTPRALRLRFQRGKTRGFVAPDGRVHIVVSPSDRGAGPARRFRRMNFERHYDPEDIEAGPIPEPARPAAAAAPSAAPPDPLIERLVASLEAQVTDMRKRLDEAERSQSELRRLLLHSQQAISDLTRRLTGLPTPRPEFDTPEPEKPTAKTPEPPPPEAPRAAAPPPPPTPPAPPPPEPPRRAEMPRPPEPSFSTEAPRMPEPPRRSEAPLPPRGEPPRGYPPPPPPPPPFLSPSMWWMWPLMWPPPRK
jgi:hypothetical protein